jgi:hypothetical protein
VRASADCTLKIDGESTGTLRSGEVKKLSLTKGEHLLEAVSADEARAMPWSRVVTINAGAQSVAVIEFSTLSHQEVEPSALVGSWELRQHREGTDVRYRSAKDEARKKNGSPYTYVTEGVTGVHVVKDGPQLLGEFSQTTTVHRSYLPDPGATVVKISFELTSDPQNPGWFVGRQIKSEASDRFPWHCNKDYPNVDGSINVKLQDPDHLSVIFHVEMLDLDASDCRGKTLSTTDNVPFVLVKQ